MEVGLKRSSSERKGEGRVSNNNNNKTSTPLAIASVKSNKKEQNRRGSSRGPASLASASSSGNSNSSSGGGSVSANNSKNNSVNGDSHNNSSNSVGGGSGKKFFRCTTCSYVTNVKARFTKHVKYHSMPLIKCDFCDFKTPYKWNLDRHYKNHNGEGDLHCPLCNFTADIKQSLTVHVQNHHSSFPDHKLSLVTGSGGSSGNNSSGGEMDDVGNSSGSTNNHSNHKKIAGVTPNDHSMGYERMMKLDQSQRGSGKASAKQQKQGTQSDRDEILAAMNLLKNAKTTVQEVFVGGSSNKGQQQPRRKSVCSNKDDSGMDESFQQKSVFLQNLALKPNVLYSFGNGGDDVYPASPVQLSLPSSPPKQHTTPKSSPPGRRLSVTSELSSSKKLHGSNCSGGGNSPPSTSSSSANKKPSREKKLGLEELTQKLLVASKIEENSAGMFKNSVTITSNSTRCQFCRQRCKTSTDLAIHLTVCSEVQRASDESSNSNDKMGEEDEELEGGEDLVIRESSQPRRRRRHPENHHHHHEGDDVPDDAREEEDADEEEGEEYEDECTSENKIFVWNNNPYNNGTEEEMGGMSGSAVMDYGFGSHFLEGGGSGSDELVGFETAPGVGAVHLGKLEEAEYEGYKGDLLLDDGQDGACITTTTRKVFRCPQPNCGFWATTASRFHVHIVGHYNMKPFECSQCSYKSNWRWDITKHIKLKAMRDPTHEKAKVLLTHESGQRNYRKYDRYLVVMQLKHSADSKLPDCSTVASKRNDVEMELSPSPGAVVVASPKVSPQMKGVSISNSTSLSTLMVGNSNGGSVSITAMTMPKLTRAPITSRASSPTESVKSEESSSSRQRPPPALVPISGSNPSGSTVSGGGGRTFVEKKMLSGGRILSAENVSTLMTGLGLPEISVEPCGMVEAPSSMSTAFASSAETRGPPTKKPRADSAGDKKILWKCKKCPFKHASKEIVVFHIRQYHKPKKGESVSILSRNHLTSVPQDDEESQHSSISDGTMTLERKLKMTAINKETHQYLFVEENSILKCKLCPYTTTNLGVMESHAENHLNKPSGYLSCAHCSFSVATKKELLQHTQLHGWDPGQPDDKGVDEVVGAAAATLVGNNLTITAEETPPRPRSNASGGSGSTHKKYHCTECPYVTDSKGQFLYHKQFHRPRDCPFKCSQCSYTVSHKHLLHQHLRVHGLPPLSPTLGGGGSDVGSIPGTDDDEANNSSGLEDQPLNLHQNSNGMDSKAESSHPTVLVWRNGRPFRMYRCRLCPQVYGKLGDLTEHEMSHGNNNSILSASPAPPPPTTTTSATPTQSPLNASLLQSQQNITISPVSSHDSNATVTVNGGGGSSTTAATSVTSPQKVLYCCESCPARFFYEKELEIHTSFHQAKSEFQCQLCSYSAKQQNPHLMSHMKVHGAEYQLKTQQLLLRYPKGPTKRKSTTKSQPAPKNGPLTPVTTATLLNIPQIMPGGRSLLANGQQEGGGGNSKNNGTPATTIVCQKCPAKFHSNASFQQHLTFHGRESNFRCRHCDYGVDTLKNMTLHELLHAGSEISSEYEASPFPASTNASSNAKGKTNGIVVSHSLHMNAAAAEEDRLDDDAYTGNPDFIYPTYVKNGRVKSKRYKCSKCPSAFEKRDQYKVHMGLHGSDQRYRCTVCDYAVTYYANFIQHLKKHSTQPEVPPELLIAKPLSKLKSESLQLQQQQQLAAAAAAAAGAVNNNNNNDKSLSTTPTKSTSASPVPRTSTPVENGPPPKKKIMLMRTRKCNMCPYTTEDMKLFEAHKARHEPTPRRTPTPSTTMVGSRKKGAGSIGRSIIKCTFCEYVAPTKVSMKEHVRLHFQVPTETLHSYMFSKEIDIYVNGNYDEKIYSEKENYEDDDSGLEKDSSGSTHSGSTNDPRPISYVDLKRGLPLSMIDDGGAGAEDDEDVSDPDTSLNHLPDSPQPMDCTV